MRNFIFWIKNLTKSFLVFFSFDLVYRGDPAAPSSTATLLRLHPSHQLYLQRLSPKKVKITTLGIARFRGVTGGVYKARERIHRRIADQRLLAIPT
jgi:hypothetical protein